MPAGRLIFRAPRVAVPRARVLTVGAGLREGAPAECGVARARSEARRRAGGILEAAFADSRAVAIEAGATADTGEGLAAIEEAGAFAEGAGFTEGAAVGRR